MGNSRFTLWWLHMRTLVIVLIIIMVTIIIIIVVVVMCQELLRLFNVHIEDVREGPLHALSHIRHVRRVFAE